MSSLEYMERLENLSSRRAHRVRNRTRIQLPMARPSVPSAPAPSGLPCRRRHSQIRVSKDHWRAEYRDRLGRDLTRETATGLPTPAESPVGTPPLGQSPSEQTLASGQAPEVNTRRSELPVSISTDLLSVTAVFRSYSPFEAASEPNWSPQTRQQHPYILLSQPASRVRDLSCGPPNSPDRAEAISEGTRDVSGTSATDRRDPAAVSDRESRALRAVWAAERDRQRVRRISSDPPPRDEYTVDEEIPPYRAQLHRYLDLILYDERFTPILRVNRHLVQGETDLQAAIGKLTKFNLLPATNLWAISHVDDTEYESMIPMLIPYTDYTTD